MTKLPVLESREHFGFLFSQMGFKGHGAEIGVQFGNFSGILMRGWQYGTLHLIDRWRECDDYKDISRCSELDEKIRYLTVVVAFSPYHRVVVHKMDSLEAADMFRDGYFDWVYIDADHRYVPFKADINAWYPKVRSGGIVAGHDHVVGVFPEGEFGVKTVVDEFVAEHGLELSVTKEKNWPSWYFLKP